MSKDPVPDLEAHRAERESYWREKAAQNAPIQAAAAKAANTPTHNESHASIAESEKAQAAALQHVAGAMSWRAQIASGVYTELVAEWGKRFEPMITGGRMDEDVIELALTRMCDLALDAAAKFPLD